MPLLVLREEELLWEGKSELILRGTEVYGRGLFRSTNGGAGEAPTDRAGGGKEETTECTVLDNSDGRSGASSGIDVLLGCWRGAPLLLLGCAAGTGRG